MPGDLARPSGLAALLHLCDTLFPIGGYAHSDGLEAATAAGQIATASDLRLWMAALLQETLGRAEGPAVVRARRAVRREDWPALRRLDDDVFALRPSSAARAASRGVGTRLVKTWGRLYPGGCSVPSHVGDAWTLPVAFTLAAASIGADAHTAVESYIYTRAAATTSAAMRLMAIGQIEAHRLLADTLAAAPAVVDRLLADDEDPSSFAPLTDLAMMQQQYVTTRLFRS